MQVFQPCETEASPEILIINGAECEPLLRTDRYLMIHEAEKLVSGVDLICRELSIPEGRIALKKTYTKEIEALTAAIEKLHSKVQLHLMDSFIRRVMSRWLFMK